MSATSFTDDLVRDYLLFRGFTSTLKAFEAELKTDKDKGFRVDKIVDQLFGHISSYDLASLREAWSHLDQRVFARLEHGFLTTVRKLENGLLKMYVINTVQTNRHDKLVEFFEKMAHDLHNQSEWKEWFCLPFMKSPEENPNFAVYCTRQWQETLQVSLHNFLSVVFQSMALPTLMCYEEDHNRIAQLQEEIESLKQQIINRQNKDSRDNIQIIETSHVVSGELMDDFYIIAQEAHSTDTQGKSIRSLIKNISCGLPTSPILGRKPTQSQQLSPLAKKSHVVPSGSEDHSGKSLLRGSKPRTLSAGAQPSGAKMHEASARLSGGHNSYAQSFSHQKDEGKSETAKKPEMPSEATNTSNIPRVITSEFTGKEETENAPFLLLSQDVFKEHQSVITHCKFNASGSVIASSDVNGVTKVWTPSPNPQTVATVMSKSSVLALEWVKNERLLILGTQAGALKLYDIREKKTVFETKYDQSSTKESSRVSCLACNPSEASFVCSVVSPSVDSSLATGRLCLWDMKVMKLEKTRHLEPFPAAVNNCVFNHNGQLLLAGAADGRITLFDMRRFECIAMWQAHTGEAFSVQFSADETSCFSIGEDKRFIQWSINKTGQKISDNILSTEITRPHFNSSPVGKLFAFDSEGKHLLTCGQQGGHVYALNADGSVKHVLSLGGHKSPTITVDWSPALECGNCITASIDGEIRVTTLLAQ